MRPVEVSLLVGDVRTQVTSIGQGPAILVVLGGHPTGRALLRRALDRLGAVVRLVFYDPDQTVPGRQPPVDDNLAALANLTEHVRDTLGLGDVVLFGHADSALIVREYAQRWPAHIAGLVLCLDGVDIADPLANVAVPALVIAGTGTGLSEQPDQLADIVHTWLVAEILP